MRQYLLYLTIAFVLVMILLGWGSVVLLPKTGYYPHLVVSSGSEVSTEFFFSGFLEQASCEKMLATRLASAKAQCPVCKLESQCSLGLSEFHRRVLGNQPIPETSIRLVNGVLVIHANNSTEALSLCALIKKGLQGEAGFCAAPGMAR